GKDLKTNTLFVEPDSEHPYLYSDAALITDIIWRGPKIEGEMTAKFRYRQKDHCVSVKWTDDKTALVSYPQKIRSITPGQVCAFYQGETCLGAGFIQEAYLDKKVRQYS
ncbi:MAG: tRNA 2-thiouridine(34) synthase MnmA, partial [Acholeplasmataceae bacterium]|nr:tRNA 2-thiouridine(34) synthase MnmA [Acholeplasmataceae bacterium]